MFVRTLLDVLFITNVFSFQGTNRAAIFEVLLFSPQYFFSHILEYVPSKISCAKIKLQSNLLHLNIIFLKVSMNFQNRTAGNSP